MRAFATASKRCCGRMWRSNRRPAPRSICSSVWPWNCARDELLRNARGQPRLVARRGVAVDDALGRHLVDERLQVRQRRLGGGDVLGVEGLADALQAGAQPGAQGAVVLTTLDVLPIGLEGRLVALCHVLTTPTLRNLQTHNYITREPGLGKGSRERAEVGYWR